MGATTTWVNNVTEGQTFFETEETDVQPLSDVMIYRWQTNDPRLAFQLDTFGADWYIGSFLGMYDDGNNYYSLLGITMSNFEIELGGVAGAGFVITPFDHTAVGTGFFGSTYFQDTISGRGSFTSISLKLSLANIQPGQLGTLMRPYDWSTGTPNSSRFDISGIDGEIFGGVSAIAVPEPSTYGLALVTAMVFATLRRR